MSSIPASSSGGGSNDGRRVGGSVWGSGSMADSSRNFSESAATLGDIWSNGVSSILGPMEQLLWIVILIWSSVTFTKDSGSTKLPFASSVRASFRSDSLDNSEANGMFSKGLSNIPGPRERCLWIVVKSSLFMPASGSCEATSALAIHATNASYWMPPLPLVSSASNKGSNLASGQPDGSKIRNTFFSTPDEIIPSPVSSNILNTSVNCAILSTGPGSACVSPTPMCTQGSGPSGADICGKAEHAQSTR
mmetsp:Transcript_31507/g.86740  ORF Transcript_31507/g.86740 Transcript_31507/m.86740 type:complete len:249 (-) Transcript_31507:31-777(-)|eukprot:CAMPEP_0117531866 /NCGR_PEP_ID=MMETSP0784-20121206/39077_1 /TAXON_ID=39447 /ORGANISM="" /LENGTH=248 /DNA_ID=CAMNT_0005328249 /DNA_START=306 /DNA_END=1052 /DNA_ORIENTATION=-